MNADRRMVTHMKTHPFVDIRRFIFIKAGSLVYDGKGSITHRRVVRSLIDSARHGAYYETSTIILCSLTYCENEPCISSSDEAGNDEPLAPVEG